MLGKMFVHTKNSHITFEDDVKARIQEYAVQCGCKPAAVLIRTDNTQLLADDYEGVIVIRKDIISPNNFWLLSEVSENRSV